MDQEFMEREARLTALEIIVCQHLAMFYREVPAGYFEEATRQSLEGARRQTFPGLDPEVSDLAADEIEDALRLLWSSTAKYLEKARRR
jgi:hypothetical protein